MFVFTAEGAKKEINKLLDRIDALEPRLDKLRSISREAEMLGLPDDGGGQFVDQITNGATNMEEDLRRAKLEVMSDPTRWREVMPLLKVCKEEMASAEKVLNQIQTSVRKAEARVARDFGRS